MEKRGGVRGRRVLLLAAAALGLALSFTVEASAAAAGADQTPPLQSAVRAQSSSSPAPFELATGDRATSLQSQDVVIAGGMDGRVYAINAWTGETLWTFDSGGPMVDFSACDAVPTHRQEPSRASQQQDPLHATVHTAESGEASSSVDADTPDFQRDDAQGIGLGTDEQGAIIEKRRESIGVVAAGAAVLGKLVPSYDGRLYHFSKSKAKELGMTMIDIIGANGPVRLEDRGTDGDNLSDVIMFGEKKTEIFALDAASGLIQPYYPRSTTATFSPATQSASVLFGRAEFTTRAVHARNASATRCFKIAEYFLQFTAQPRCSRLDEEKPKAASFLPEILVLQKDPDAVEEDEGSTIAAYDPWTNQQLWELEIPHFDVLAFRLRLLGDNYYLESSNEDESNLSGSEMSSADSSFDDVHMDELFKSRLARGPKRRVFWEPIVNDGKRGVFITYYHVGAMMVGVMVGCLLIAWGCYVKGLSTSIAQSAIKSMDSNQFFVSHVHQLTIERPGEDNITISSVISRPLLMAALDSSMALLDSDDASRRRPSGIDVDIDPATEAKLMEKFARVAAIDAASALASSTFSSAKATMLELEYDAAASADASVSSALVVRSRGSSSIRSATTGVLALTDGVASVASAFDFSSETFEIEEKIPASIVELDSVSGDETTESETKGSEEIAVDVGDGCGVGVTAGSSEKSVGSPWSSDSESSVSSSSESSAAPSSDGDGSSNTLDASSESSAKDSDSSASRHGSLARKTSDASSSDSSHTTEAEVLFPFVCQSRFANEFEEISAIGKGGFGQVILAENRLDGRKYAIKRVGLHLKNQTSKTLQKFLREVKILALLDHPNIVRYYQAWLEKVEDSVTGLFGSLSDADSSLTGAPGRNYSMSNLLAPISEMEFSENQRSQVDFYSEGGGLDNDDDDGGFEWERDSSAGASEDQGWREEDLIRSNSARHRKRRQNVVAVNVPAKDSSMGEERLSAEKCDHWLYIQMQYCAGRNLGDFLALPNRPMHLPKLLKIFVQIASALAHVHSCGLIHRDLKPANIFVADTEGDSIKLGDFGLSRYAANVNLNNSGVAEEHHHLQTTTSVASSSVNLGSGGQHIYSSSVWSVSMSNVSENEVTAGVGTYLYASPEQVAGKKYNAKTDVYSLGMILFELCHERFTTTMERYIALRNARENTFPSEFRWKKMSPELLRMIAQLLSHDPAARPSVDEVVKWGQDMYEASLYHHAMSAAMRSPLNPPRGYGDVAVTSFDLLGPGGFSSVFSFHVEAKTESSGAESGAAGGGDRRLPNHDLLKEICDVIAQVGKDQVEIKKCGLQLQDGVQILEFMLEARLSDGGVLGGSAYDYKAVVVAIEALSGVRQVRRL